MDTRLYATRIQSAVLTQHDRARNAYDYLPDATRFWAFVDLCNSSKYRVLHGPREGYIRAESFFTLVRETIAPCPEIDLVKEIGDAVLLSADSLRPLFESVVLMHMASQLLAFIGQENGLPFSLRAAIGFGPAKRLVRLQTDYVGSPIDALSRIMGIRSAESSILGQDNIFNDGHSILTEYSQFLRIGPPKPLSAEQAKGLPDPVYYREMMIDMEALSRFRECFAPWRTVAERAMRESDRSRQ